MLLNILDLIVSIIGVIQLFTLRLGVVSDIIQALNFTLLEVTGFSTCLLSVTRSFKLFAPNRRINSQILYISFSVFLVYSFLREMILVLIHSETIYFENNDSLFNNIHFGILLPEMGLMVFMVLVVNIACILKFRRVGRVKRDTTFAQATMTVIFLSVSFCCLNTLYIISVFIRFISSPNDVDNLLINSGCYLAIPLNSTTNPLIYLVRNRRMRDYIKSLIRSNSRNERVANQD